MVEISRGVDATLLAEVSKTGFNPVVLVFVDWPNGALRFHSGNGSLSWDGQTWMGLASGDKVIGDISIPPETGGTTPQEFSLKLYSEWAALAAEVVGVNATGISSSVWFGAVTEPGGTTLVGEPFKAVSGTATGDILSMPDNGVAQYTITLKGGSHGRVAFSNFHSDADQRAAYPTDTIGQRFINAEQWGASQKW